MTLLATSKRHSPCTHPESLRKHLSPHRLRPKALLGGKRQSLRGTHLPPPTPFMRKTARMPLKVLERIAATEVKCGIIDRRIAAASTMLLQFAKQEGQDPHSKRSETRRLAARTRFPSQVRLPTTCPYTSSRSPPSFRFGHRLRSKQRTVNGTKGRFRLRCATRKAGVPD